MTAQPIRVVIVGSVDHGKSTFIGRFLYDTGSLTPDKIADLEKTSQDTGQKMEFAHVMDQFQEERERNVTIDTAQTFFSLNEQPYVFVDAPGHKEYLKNMITGATQASHAILLLDAQEGIQPQTEKHVQILQLLGLKKLVVLTNKMDLIQHDQNKFLTLKKELEQLLARFELTADHVIPISAYQGDNVVHPSSHMSWYTGPTALQFVKDIKDPTESQEENQPAWFPVQMCHTIKKESYILGRLEQGVLTENEAVRIFPSNQTAKIKQIVRDQKKLKQAQPGESVALVLDTKDPLDRGTVVYGGSDPAQPVQSFITHFFWAAETPLNVKQELTVECRTQSASCVVEKIQDEWDKENLSSLNSGDVGLVQVHLTSPIWVEPNKQGAIPSRVVFHQKGDVVGCGVVESVTRAALVFLLFSSESWAYIDPGSGMAFVSGIGAWLLGLFALVFGSLTLTVKKWMGWVKRLFSFHKKK